MKKLLTALITISMFVSCNQEPTKDYAVVTGKILNMSDAKLKINSLRDPFSKTITLSEDGSFIDTLKVSEDNYMIYDGKNVSYVYLEAGDNVNFTYDVNDYGNTVKFTGIGAEVNTYLVQKAAKEKEIKGEGNVYELNEAEFKATQKGIEAACSELISNTKNLPKSFVEKEKRNIRYAYLNKLELYESYHAYYAKEPEFKVSEGFLDELKSLVFDSEEDYGYSINYRNLISSHFNNEAKKVSEAESIDQDVALLRALKTLQNDSIRNAMLYKNAAFNISFSNDVEAFYNAFITASTNEVHNKDITEKYTVLKKVAKGQPSPKFVDYENAEGGTMSLDDLKGKYTYIDVWATWCGPCKAEIPHLKKIEEAYHSKNIQFVSISVDKAKDHDKWKQMIADENLGGIQLLAENAFESQFVKDYMILGIPRFILLDPNGQIIASNAPRPSNQELIELFNELNI